MSKYVSDPKPILFLLSLAGACLVVARPIPAAPGACAAVEVPSGGAECDAAMIGAGEDGGIVEGLCSSGCSGLVKATCDDGQWQEVYADCDPRLGSNEHARLLSPPPKLSEGINDDGTITFAWSAASRDSIYLFMAGSDPAMPYQYFFGATGDETDVDVVLPLDGSPIYARLVTVNGPYATVEDYAYPDGACGDNRPARISSHEPAQTISTAVSNTFEWTGASEPDATYYVLLGSAPGGVDYGLHFVGTQTQLVADEIRDPSGQPLDGEPVFVRLVTVYPAATQCADAAVYRDTYFETVNGAAPNPDWYVVQGASGRTVGKELDFDAGGSTDIDSDESALQYRWKFGGRDWTAWRKNPSKAFTFRSGGEQRVKLKVKDPEGHIAKQVGVVDVLPNQDPRADFEILNRYDRIYTGEKVKLKATPRDWETPLESLEVRWKFDEGCGWTEWTHDRRKKHRYSTAGTKRVKLETRDLEGNTDKAADDVTIAKLPFCHDVGVDYGMKRTCRPPGWCDANCQLIRLRYCSHTVDSWGEIHPSPANPALCQNTPQPPDTKEQFERAKLIDYGIASEPAICRAVIGLSRSKLEQLLPSGAVDEIMDGYCMTDFQRPTIEAKDLVQDYDPSVTSCIDASCASICYRMDCLCPERILRKECSSGILFNRNVEGWMKLIDKLSGDVANDVFGDASEPPDECADN